MVLRMACPTKRPGSDNWYFRRRIPKEAQAILAKLPASQRPKGWFKSEFMVSLGTADRAIAKAKCSEVAAEFERTLATLRAGPKGLSPKQIAALSGELYKAFAQGLEDDPVLTAEQWQRVAAYNEEARQGRYGTKARLGIFRSEDERREASMEAPFGKMTDAFLRQRSILTTDDSRFALIERASLDLSEAAKKLARNADGDYSPDEYAKRFPEFDQRKSDGSPTKSLKALSEAWHKAAPDRGLRPRTTDRFKSRFDKLIQFLGHDDARRVTRQDIIRWVDHRLASGISRKTIDDSDISAFHNVFEWGKDRDWVTHNPAVNTRDKRKKRPPQIREKYFLPPEIARILTAAAGIVGTPRENPKTTAAKRWVPWLCAYSGARVAEMIQLRKEDIREDASHGWTIRLNPAAGAIKNNQYCDVPVHRHLLATGFIEFVQSSSKGHLFCDVGEDGTITGPAGGVYDRVRASVREALGKEPVQPNHAWRYTFKAYGLEAGIQEGILHAISNHAPRSHGEEYMKVTLKTRAEAMAKFPRYKLT